MSTNPFEHVDPLILTDIDESTLIPDARKWCKGTTDEDKELYYTRKYDDLLQKLSERRKRELLVTAESLGIIAIVGQTPAEAVSEYATKEFPAKDPETV